MSCARLRSALRSGILCVLPALLLLALSGFGEEEPTSGAYLDSSDLLMSAPSSPSRATREGDGETLAGPSPSLLGAEASGERLDAATRRPDAPPSALGGRVVDEFGSGLEAVHVTLSRAVDTEGEAALSIREIETDSSGAFRFAALPGGRFHIQAEAEDYGPAWRTNVVAGTWIELRLAPAARLKVEVRGPDKAPVPGATVRVGRPGFLRQRTTDPRGLALFPRLPIGSLEVAVFGTRAAALPRIVSLSAAEPALIVLTLSPARPLRGRVTEAGDGAPVPGATVTVRAEASPTVCVATAFTRADGSFEFSPPSPFLFPFSGRGILVVTKQGYAEGRAPLPGLEAATEPEITLHRQRRLEGQVVDSKGRAVSGAQLAWATALADRAKVASDARGRFTISLPPAPTRDSLHALVCTDGGGRMGAVAVRLASDLQPLVVVLRDSGRVTGRIIDAAGRPVVGALVRLEASGAYVPGLAADGDEAWARRLGCESLAGGLNAVSGVSGAYRLPAVPAGAWTTHLVHGAFSVRGRSPLLLTEGAVLSSDLTVGEIAALFGRVLDSEDRPVAGARVLVSPSGGGRGLAATSSADGRYLLEGLATDRLHTLTASAPGHAPLYLENVLPGARPFDLYLAPPAGFKGQVIWNGEPHEEPVEVWLVPGGTREGKDAALSAVPVPAPKVALQWSGARNARFEIAPPYAGGWLLCAATRDGRLVAEPLALEDSQAGGQDGLVLYLVRAAVLEGRTQPRAVVSLHTRSGREVVARPLASLLVGQSGHFTLRGLPEGSLQLRVASPSGKVFLREVFLEAGRLTDVDVLLPSN